MPPNKQTSRVDYNVTFCEQHVTYINMQWTFSTCKYWATLMIFTSVCLPVSFLHPTCTVARAVQAKVQDVRGLY